MTGLQVTVEIAFGHGFKTAAADLVWEDVTDLVDGPISISHGRQDERQPADANTCAFRLDNSSGDLTPIRGTLVPTIPMYTPIRVTVEPPETPGVPMDRFYGYVTGWDLGWDAVESSAFVEVAAASRLGRLGRARPLRSVIEETFLLNAPAAYYTLGDGEGSSAAESSGNGLPSAVQVGTGAAVTFATATGPGTDGLSAAQFAGGKYLAADFFPIAAGTGISVEAFVLTTTLGDGIVQFGDLTIQSDAFGNATTIVFISGAGYALNGSTSITDGSTHHVAATWDGVTLKLYVDGVLDASLAQAGTPSTADKMWIGNARAAAPATAVVAHAAGYTHTLTLADIEAHVASGTTGAAGETTSERLVRYASWGGVPASQVVTDGMDRTVAHVDPGGSSVVEMVQKLAATEDGVVYDTRSGDLRGVSGSLRNTAEPAVTLDMAEQHVEADFQPQYSPDTVLNMVTVTPPESVGAPANLENAASRDAYGDASTTVDIVGDDPNDAGNLAGWLLSRYAQPFARVPSVSVDVLAQAGGTPGADELMALDVGSRVVIENQPAQAPSATGDYFVEGYTESIWPYAYSMTLNLSPGAAYANVLILNDSTRAELDAGYVLGF